MTKTDPSSLYYEDGTIKITMIDVRRLLPKHDVRSFQDLRDRSLVSSLEHRYCRYKDEGGRFRRIDERGMTDAFCLNPHLPSKPNLYYLLSLNVIKKITGVKPETEKEILNHKWVDRTPVKERVA